jgi:hypothetical protein
LSREDAIGEAFQHYVAALFWLGGFFVEYIALRATPYEKARRQGDTYRDLKVRHRRTGRTLDIECKYRRRADLASVDVTRTQRKLGKIQDRDDKRGGRRFFFVIGLGGEPVAPEAMYVVPAEDVTNRRIPREYLEKYRREDPAGPFLLNGNRLE